MAVELVLSTVWLGPRSISGNDTLIYEALKTELTRHCESNWRADWRPLLETFYTDRFRKLLFLSLSDKSRLPRITCTSFPVHHFIVAKQHWISLSLNFILRSETRDFFISGNFETNNSFVHFLAGNVASVYGKQIWEPAKIKMIDPKDWS